MKITLWPKTASGKWVAILGIACILLTYLKMRQGFLLPTLTFASLGLQYLLLVLILILKR